jgi:hypothetical protein
VAIERHGDMRSLTCDDCGDLYEEFPDKEFASVTSAAKSEGWTFVADGPRMWKHYCTTCTPETPLERARKKFAR